MQKKKKFITKKVRIILSIFALSTGAFYFFTDVNLTISVFFAFVVAGLIGIILSDNGFSDEEVLENAFLQYQGIRPGPLNPDDD